MSITIWKHDSDRVVYMRHLGKKEDLSTVSDFVEQKPLVQCTIAKKLTWDPKDENIY